MTPYPKDQTNEELAARFSRIYTAGDTARRIWPHLTPITARNKLEKLRARGLGPKYLKQPDSNRFYYSERDVLLWLATWDECTSTSQTAETA